MADPAQLRTRRSRAHRAGDHSLCRPQTCDAAVLAAGAPTPGTAAAMAMVDGVIGGPADPLPEGERVPGKIESGVAAFCEALPYPEGDPRRLLANIAVLLAQRVDQSGALPAAVRELRVLLVQLVEVPNGPSGHVDETRLRRAQARLDQIIRASGSG